VSNCIIYKLVNNDCVIARVEETSKVVILNHPMVINVIKKDNQTIIMMSQYMPFATAIKQFSEYHILAAVEASDEIIELYDKAINKQSNEQPTTDRSFWLDTEHSNKILH